MMPSVYLIGTCVHVRARVRCVCESWCGPALFCLLPISASPLFRVTLPVFLFRSVNFRMYHFGCTYSAGILLLPSFVCISVL